MEVAEEVAKEKRDLELYKLVVYYYAEFFGISKLHEFEEFARKFETKGLLHVADLYSLLGYPEKALEIYEGVLAEEKRPEIVGEVYYSIAAIYEELQEYEKAIEFIRKAIEEFKAANAKRKELQARVYEGYLLYESGDKVKAKEILAKLLAEVEDKELIAQIHLAFEEMFEDEENYEAAFHECLYAMINSKDSDFFEIAFDGLVDLIWQAIIDDSFEEIYNSMPMFKVAFPELSDFFEGVRLIALYKDGKAGREDVSAILDRIKDERLLSILEFLGEAEL